MAKIPVGGKYKTNGPFGQTSDFLFSYWTLEVRARDGMERGD
jgi:hypothetical protein